MRRVVVVVLIAIVMFAGWAWEEYRWYRQIMPGRLLIGFVVTCLMIIAILIGFHAAHAHDHEHPELNGWYQSLESGRGPCCDGTDAVHLADPDWESHDGHYRVRLPKNPNITYDLEVNGEWVDVPDDAIVKGPNRDGRALVWPMYRDGHPVPRCFMPGSMT